MTSRSALAAFIALAAAAAPAHAAFPGANGKIAFQRSAAAGSDQIHVANPDGSGRVQVSRPQHYMYGTDGFVQPTFSADGTKLVMMGQSGGSLWTVYANGAQLKKLDGALDHTAFAEQPSFTPDGSRIVFGLSVSPDPQQPPVYKGIHSIRASDGGDLRQHTNGVDFDPVVSPDGARLAFTRNLTGDAGDGQLLVADADGSNPVPVYTGQGLDEFPNSVDWSPDSQTLVFAKKHNGIYTVPAAGGDVRTISPHCQDPATGCAWDSHPGFSPDGTKILFTRTTPVKVGEGENTLTLYTMPADGLGTASAAFAGTTDSGGTWAVHTTAQLPEPEPDATSGKPDDGTGTTTGGGGTTVVTEGNVGLDARLLTLRGRRGLPAFASRRGFRVPVGASVAGTVKLTAHARGRKVGAGRASVKAGIAMVALKANAAGRRLGRGRSLKLQVKGSFRSAAGRTVVLGARRVTLTR